MKKAGTWKTVDVTNFKDVPAADPMVEHPPHYHAGTAYEAIRVIEAWELGFHLGNAVKYICRANLKDNRLQNLQKARWYLDREIRNMEKGATCE